MFYVQKAIQNYFLVFCHLLAYFEQKVAKKHIFCVIFLKNGDLWSKFNITNVFRLEFPFLKCKPFKYFYEFVQ